MTSSTTRLSSPPASRLSRGSLGGSLGSLGSRSLDEELEILSNSDSSSASGGGGGGEKVVKKEINVVLPGPRMRLMAVDAGMPMRDLLVHLCGANHLSPTQFFLEATDAEGAPIAFKQNDKI